MGLAIVLGEFTDYTATIFYAARLPFEIAKLTLETRDP
jgi:hypothetical protein